MTRIEEVVGKVGLERMGKRVWRKRTVTILQRLKLSLIADYVVVGGGNAKQFTSLPEGLELGNNRNAFLGGCRLWETDSRTRRPKWHIID